MARKSRCETIKIKIHHIPANERDELAINQGYQMMKRLIAEAVIRDISLDQKDNTAYSCVK